MKYSLLCIFLAALTLTASAEGPEGRDLFQTHCTACHGANGLGDGPAAQALNPPPRDLTVRPYKQGCGPGAIVKTLQSGVKGSGMPSFSNQLSEDEMWSLAHYVRSLQKSCCNQ